MGKQSNTPQIFPQASTGKTNQRVVWFLNDMFLYLYSQISQSLSHLFQCRYQPGKEHLNGPYFQCINWPSQQFHLPLFPWLWKLNLVLVCLSGKSLCLFVTNGSQEGSTLDLFYIQMIVVTDFCACGLLVIVIPKIWCLRVLFNSLFFIFFKKIIFTSKSHHRTFLGLHYPK